MSSEGSRFVAVGLDATGELCVWSLADRERPLRPYRIVVVGTGQDLSPLGQAPIYLGHAVRPPFVWHVFLCDSLVWSG